MVRMHLFVPVSMFDNSKFYFLQSEQRINIDVSPWDLSTFQGRLRYFFWVTDPRLCLADDKTLDEAKTLRNLYK